MSVGSNQNLRFQSHSQKWTDIRAPNLEMYAPTSIQKNEQIFMRTQINVLTIPWVVKKREF